MPAELLRDLSRSSVSVPRRRWSMLPVSMGAHAIAAVAVLVIPLAAEIELPPPAPLSLPHFIVSLAPPPVPVAVRAATTRSPVGNQPAAPLSAPRGVAPEKPLPPNVPAGTVIADGGLDVAYGVPYGTGSIGAPAGVVVVPAPPPPPPARTAPIRIANGIREPRKIAQVMPVYPAIARDNRIEGIVILEAIINERGTIDRIKVLQSVTLLDQAAIEAVRQWRYTPTLLNGVPVPVLITIGVRFTLER